MKKREIRISCAQIHSVSGNKKENLTKMKAFADKTLQQYPDTDLIVFPEYALSGSHPSPDQVADTAEPFNGPSTKEMAAYARENNVFIVFGYLEKQIDTDILYNSAVLIDNKGQALGQYRKTHLVEAEKPVIQKGNLSYPVFDTEIGKIGIMICWDSAFPEVARTLALKGADYLVIPAAWEKPQQRDWDLVQSARAFDNVIFTACCNLVGKDVDLEFFGRSRITGPTGEILSDVIEDEEAIISASFDMDEKQALREGYYALLKDRRPDTYMELVREGKNE